MRAMTREDVEAVLAIEQAVQRFPWTRGNFADALDSGYICRVDEAGEGGVCAYAIMIPVVDEAELLNIGVAATQQRRGLGRKMLAEILDMARERNMRRVFLEVRPSNVAAIALYRSAGFKEIGVRHGYYRNADGSEDAVTMTCEINHPAASGGVSGRVDNTPKACIHRLFLWIRAARLIHPTKNYAASGGEFNPKRLKGEMNG